ncbi:MAG TPA: tRNA (adenosine(37)-N6)-dimethylallyltransferase MiaA [Chloroflexota bacterium]|nr:tRNA (adenosine(37)-N6)-dimethylallyltransferase MiaA [Chloroflexota bacterium]
MSEPVAAAAAPPIVAMLGPTGVGKSAFAMELVGEYGGEIISADSRQVYRYLDIGTDKPSPEERVAVRHHAVDVVLPDQRYTVVDFRRDASQALVEIGGREGVAVVVGGTGQYAQSFLEGASIPVSHRDETTRARLERHVATVGTGEAMAEIAALDPATAERIDANNPRRVVRALEILHSTGAPIPPIQRQPLPALVLALRMDRTRHYELIDARVERQVASGLVEETQRVLGMGFSAELPVLSGLAYGSMIRHIDGELSLEAAIQEYKFATHSLVRRQMTWFRKQPRVQWFDAGDSDSMSAARRAVAEYLDAL